MCIMHSYSFKYQCMIILIFMKLDILSDSM